jgi:SOS-response transcriptional repressor LexA
MIVDAGSMPPIVAMIATKAIGDVGKSPTDEACDLRYAKAMMDLWLKDALAHSDLSQAELARRLTEKLRKNIDRAAVNKMTLGKREISGKEMLAIEDITGWEAPLAREAKIEIIPRLSWVSAGQLCPGEPIRREDADSFVAVADLPRGQWAALEVRGDSMDRIAPDGSLILVDFADTRLVDGKFFVFKCEDDHGTSFKRFRTKPDRFVPYSTNPEHEPYYPDGPCRVLGRAWRVVTDLK